jgi:5-methylcytosine-specific restriction protein A
MSERALRPCRQEGCPNNTRDGYCPEHQKNNSVKAYDAARRDAATRRLYFSTAYLKFRNFLMCRNAQCQRIENGIRCMEMSRVLHHLIDPKIRPGLFLKASNCVCLCFAHHPGGEAGTPTWEVGRDYVATYGGLSMCGDKPEE